MVDQAKDVLKWIGKDASLVQLLEPLFLYGIGIGLIFFALCFFFKQEAGRKIGLAVIIICCALVYPYLKFSEKVIGDVDKDEKFDKPDLALVVDAMKKQYEKRYNTQWYYYALGGVASVSLLLGSGKPGKILSGLTLLGALVVVSFSLFMDMRDKKIHYVHMYDPIYVTTDGESSVDPDHRSQAKAGDGKEKKKNKKTKKKDETP